MPQVDGISLLRSLRQRGYDQPALFLTGHANPIFEEHGLKEGAIDFVDKSKNFGIIAQRLKIALQSTVKKSDAVAMGVSFDGLRITWHDQIVDLTATEARVVRLLVDQAGRDVSYRAIYDSAKGDGFHAGDGTDGYRANVRSIVRRIRRRFQTLDPAFEAIESFPGVGYRWRIEP
jgi:two-component system response regulator ChvI